MPPGQHVFQHGEVLKEANRLEGAGDAEVDDAVGRHSGNRLALELDLALIGTVIPGDEVEHRSLARAVRPNEPDNRCRPPPQKKRS